MSALSVDFSLAQRGGAVLAETPHLLRDYGDLFRTSVLYRETFNQLKPETGRLLAWLDDMKDLPDDVLTQGDRESLGKAVSAVDFIEASIAERLDDIMTGFGRFWSEMSRQSFRRLRRQIEDADVATAAILFTFAAKLRAWSKAFPSDDARGDAAKIGYLRALAPGLERLVRMESDARLLAAHF